MTSSAPALNIVMMGPPGSGKGTQSKIISRRFSIFHLSTGDMLRSEIAAGTELGKLAKSLIDDGEFVPDETITSIVLSQLNKHPDGFVLDGFPRTSPQAHSLLAYTDNLVVFFLDVPDDVLLERIAGRIEEGRADDDPEVVINRLKIYKERTEPMLEILSSRGVLTRIDGTLGIDQVRQDIFDAIPTENKIRPVV